MPLPFEFTIEGPPVSQQSRRRRRVARWTQDVQSAARQYWSVEPPTSAEVMVTITYFFDSAPLDVDNVPKPILDALKGLVYNDDSQVTDLICRKRERNRDMQVLNASPILQESLDRPGQFLHISVSEAQSGEVTF